MWKKILITVAISLVVGIACGWFMNGCTHKPTQPEPIVVHDTITHDSIQVKWRTRFIASDTIRVYLPIVKDAADSTQNRSSDSVKVEVPISHYSFCDTVGNDTMQTCVRIDFSGYRAKIDKAEYQQHLYIEPSVVEKKGGWSQFVGFGVQVGYGIGCANQMRFEPYIGVGVVYGFGYHWRKK